MKRLSVFCLALLTAVCANSIAAASVISAQGGSTVTLAPNAAGQQLTLLISGTDFYTDGRLVATINGGNTPAPFMTAVFGRSTIGPTLAANLVGSVWGQAGVYGGIYEAPDPAHSLPGVSGLEVEAGFNTSAFAPQNTAGTFARITLSTVGVPAGSYSFSLTGTELNIWDENEFEEVPVPLQFAPITLVVVAVPEPSTCVLAALGIVGLLICKRRKSAA